MSEQIVVDEKDLEYAMYHYGFPITFSDKGKKRVVKDLAANGYMWLARKYGLESIDSKLEHYSVDKDVRAVVKCTVIFMGRKYSAIADVDDRSNSVRDPSATARVADTLAFKRAVARALGLNSDMLQKFKIKEDGQREEEPYTPPPRDDDVSEEIEKEIESMSEDRYEHSDEDIEEDIDEEWNLSDILGE